MQVNSIHTLESLKDLNIHHTYFNRILKADLEDLMIDSTVLQYMDDLIICSSSIEQCYRDSFKVLTKLAQGGHKVSQNTIEYFQPQVKYLGRLIAFGTRAIAPVQLIGISKAPLPQTVGQIMTSLGMTGFSSDWIEDYAVKTGPLRKILKQAGYQHLSNPLKWNTDALIAFETIKKELQQAPTLGTADYSKISFVCGK